MNAFSISSLTVSTEGEKGRLRSRAPAGSGTQTQAGIWATAANAVVSQLSTREAPGLTAPLPLLTHFGGITFFFPYAV